MSLDDPIINHKHLLENAGSACRSLPSEIEKYTAVVSSLPREMVKLRLVTVQGMIKACENALQAEHENKGYIIVQVSHSMLSIYWSELDLVKGKKESISTEESVFVAPEVVLKKVEELISQVDSGELVPAIKWVNRYENINVGGLNRLP